MSYPNSFENESKSICQEGMNNFREILSTFSERQFAEMIKISDNCSYIPYVENVYFRLPKINTFTISEEITGLHSVYKEVTISKDNSFILELFRKIDEYNIKFIKTLRFDKKVKYKPIIKKDNNVKLRLIKSILNDSTNDLITTFYTKNENGMMETKDYSNLINHTLRFIIENVGLMVDFNQDRILLSPLIRIDQALFEKKDIKLGKKLERCYFDQEEQLPSMNDMKSYNFGENNNSIKPDLIINNDHIDMEITDIEPNNPINLVQTPDKELKLPSLIPVNKVNQQAANSLINPSSLNEMDLKNKQKSVNGENPLSNLIKYPQINNLSDSESDDDISDTDIISAYNKPKQVK